MSELGHLCRHYTAQNLALVYKASGAHEYSLVYKVAKGQQTTISFAWDKDGNDLDICAYWEAAPNMKAGWRWSADWSQPTTVTTVVDGVTYTLGYSGDIRDTDASEWVKIEKSVWSKGSNSFRVYLNFYGYDASQYPASTCTVIAAQENGPTKMLLANCGTHNGSRADPLQDPFVTVTFDATGKLLSLTQ